MVKARKFICTTVFDGEPKQSDFELQNEELPQLNDGGKSLIIFVIFAFITSKWKIMCNTIFFI